ncbi:MAG: hypothetical protein H6757_02370 [Candidatus Omnitrophica bacterium]|nr:hypothetical protein [Candidatus Omnitrophota bacterium]
MPSYAETGKQSGTDTDASSTIDDEVAKLMEILNRYESKFAEKSKEAEENKELIEQAQEDKPIADAETAEINKIMADLDQTGGVPDEPPAVLEDDSDAENAIYVLDKNERLKADEENALYHYEPFLDTEENLEVKETQTIAAEAEPEGPQIKETLPADQIVMPMPESSKEPESGLQIKQPSMAAKPAYIPQKNTQTASKSYRPVSGTVQKEPVVTTTPAVATAKTAVDQKTEAMPVVVSRGQAPRPVVRKPKDVVSVSQTIHSEAKSEEVVSIAQKAASEVQKTTVSEKVESAPEPPQIDSPETAVETPEQDNQEAAIVIFNDEAFDNRQGRSVRRTATVSNRHSFQAQAEPGSQPQTVVVGDITKPIIVEESVEVETSQASSRRRRVSKGFKKPEPPKPNLYAQSFFMSPNQRLSHETYDMNGLVVMKSPGSHGGDAYSIVTDFEGDTLRSRSLEGFEGLEQINDWMEKEIKTAEFEGVEIKELTLGQEQSTASTLYWVGHRSFSSADEARLQIAIVKDLVEANGENFAQLVSDASRYIPAPEKKAPLEIKTPAQFKQEEKIILKYLDQMDIGEEIFGPFQGEGTGEPIVWQSFGETTWRQTNLDKRNFSAQVGYWTNRLVFKGIRFPFSTIDPFLESTVSLEAGGGADFASNAKFFAGVEWRPFARNPWMYNFRPWAGINIAEWIRNYRFYVMYGDRKNIKDPIDGSDDHDLIAGVQIFYEWGVELPPLTAPEPETTGEYIERIIWGEYFGNYRFEMTNFGSEDDYDGWILNSSIILGVKLPGIPLPENPINNELVLMPYMRFEHVNSTAFSFPYQNQYFVAAGIRWMPFRTYRFKENEWLSKTKIFGEYVGVGLVQHAKQDGEAPNAVRWDLRFGVSFSQRRF